MGGKRSKRQQSKKAANVLGKASSLPGFLWGKWLDHVDSTGPTWLWVALVLSHALCLRITEVLRLRHRDFLWKARTVRVGPLKRQKATLKPMLSALFPVLKKLRDQGKSRRRTKQQGVRGKVVFFDRWQWPEEPCSFLFPSARSHSKEVHHSKDAVSKAICRSRLSFHVSGTFLEVEKIRSHSGRHRMINDLKAAEISQDVAMKFARIGDVRTFQGYGEVTPEQSAQALERSGRLQKQLKAVYAKRKPKK